MSWSKGKGALVANDLAAAAQTPIEETFSEPGDQSPARIFGKSATGCITVMARDRYRAAKA